MWERVKELLGNVEGKEQWPAVPGPWIQSPAEPEVSVCPQTYHLVLWVLDFTDGLDPSSSSVLWLYLSLSLSLDFH